MRYFLKKHVVTYSLLVALSMTPLAALADSGSGSGATPSAAAHLNLRVTIPEFMFFRIGSAGATIDTVTFTPLATAVGDSTSVSGSSGANVILRSNGGAVTITETNDNILDTGLVGVATRTTISLSEITASSSSTDLDTPTLSDTGGNTSSPTLNGGGVTNRSATWSYVYDNTTIPDADDYDIEITYTATTL